MGNNLKFSKNYRLKTKDSKALKTKTTNESFVSIRQHLKKSSFPWERLLETIKDSNNCVIAR